MFDKIRLFIRKKKMGLIDTKPLSYYLNLNYRVFCFENVSYEDGKKEIEKSGYRLADFNETALFPNWKEKILLFTIVCLINPIKEIDIVNNGNIFTGWYVISNLHRNKPDTGFFYSIGINNIV